MFSLWSRVFQGFDLLVHGHGVPKPDGRPRTEGTMMIMHEGRVIVEVV